MKTRGKAGRLPLIQFFAVAGCLAVVGAQENEEEKAGDQFEAMGWTAIGEVEAMSSDVERDTGSQAPVRVATLENPEITQPNHLVAGMIRHEEVAGAGYVEMWTIYEGGGRYFSRTLGDFGPMAKLSGSSDWRPLMLPFRGLADQSPERLEINVVLPGGGKVEFRDFRLYESASTEDPRWWSSKSGIMGGMIVCAAVLILLGLGWALSTTGRARGLALGILVLVGVGGLISLVASPVAAVMGQAGWVWLTLLNVGLVAIIAAGVGFPLIRRTYLKHELRRIAAADRNP